MNLVAGDQATTGQPRFVQTRARNIERSQGSGPEPRSHTVRCLSGCSLPCSMRWAGARGVRE